MKTLKTILALVLVLNLSLSAVGIQVYKHYCGSYLADLSLFIPNNPCAEEEGEDACNINLEDDCCDDEAATYALDIDFTIQNALHLSPQIAVLSTFILAPEKRKLILKRKQKDRISRSAPQ